MGLRDVMVARCRSDDLVHQLCVGTPANGRLHTEVPLGLWSHGLRIGARHSPTTQSLNAFTSGVCARASGYTR